MNWKKWALILSWLFASGPPPLAAHGLFTFAWVEGAQICTDSYFSRQSKAKGARISMLDAAGTVLSSGLTDSEGGYCFERPGTPQKLVFVVETGGGHRGEFELPSEVFPAAKENRAGPGLKEVFSGLGWLAGLAGLGFWLAARRRERESPGRQPEK